MRYFFSTLNLYFCKVFFNWFGVCTLTIIAIITIFTASEYTRRSIGKTYVHTPVILEMVLLNLPQQFELLFPFIVLLATLLTFWRLHHSAELAVARASGISVWQFLSGIGTVLFLTALLELLFLNPIAAAMTSRLQNLEAMVFGGQEHRLSISETGFWLREDCPARKNIFHANHANLDTGEFYDVNFYNFTPDGQVVSSIYAQKAALKKGRWLLTTALLWQGAKSETLPSLELSTDLNLAEIREGNLSPQSLSLWQISEYMGILEKSGLSTVRYRLYWHSQWAKLGLIVAMLLLGASFSLNHPPRRLNVWAIGLALSAGLWVYFLKDVIYALGLSDKIPLVLAAWAPVLVTALLCATLILHFEDR